MRPSYFYGGRTLPVEPTIHCLAVRVHRLWNGEIDTQDLEDYLDQTAGTNAWLTTSVWMFARAPLVMRPGFISVPVICPSEAATRLNLTECEDHRPQRVYGEHVVGAVELRGWRWVAAQVYPRPDGMGVFPWETANIGKVKLHG